MKPRQMQLGKERKLTVVSHTAASPWNASLFPHGGSTVDTVFGHPKYKSKTRPALNIVLPSKVHAFQKG